MTLQQLMDQYEIDKANLDEKYADLIAKHVEEVLKPHVGPLTHITFDQGGELCIGGERWHEYDPNHRPLTSHVYSLGSYIYGLDDGIQRYLANRIIFPKETQ